LQSRLLAENKVAETVRAKAVFKLFGNAVPQFEFGPECLKGSGSDTSTVIRSPVHRTHAFKVKQAFLERLK
jgi:hypothetical protein